MDAHSDSQAFADHAAELIQVRTEVNLSAFSLTNSLQDDCFMTDVSNPEPEVDEDPLDYPFGASHMMVLDKFPAVTPHCTSQATYTVRGCSAWEGIVGNEVSQTTRYWDAMQSPQSIPSRQNDGDCPSPTSLPSGPNLTFQFGSHAQTVSIKSVHPPRLLTIPR